MSLQYLSNERRQIIAVQVPIEEWKLLKSKYPDVDAFGVALPDWPMALIDTRLNAIEENPKFVLPIDSLMAELDSIQE